VARDIDVYLVFTQVFLYLGNAALIRSINVTSSNACTVKNGNVIRIRSWVV